MKSLFYLAAITALASSVSAAAIAKPVEMANPDDYTITVYPDGLPAELVPHAKRDTSLDKRATEAAYFCTDINFGGYCVDVQGSLYQCINLGGNLNDLVSSVGPDYGYCFFFGNYNCQDNEGHFGTYSPGYSDLRSINFNDKISSFYCNPN